MNTSSVLHVLDTDAVAGTERHLATLAAATRRACVRVAVACRRGRVADLMADAGVEVVALPGQATRPGSFSALQRAVRAGGWDVIHAHNGRSHLAAVLATAGTAARVVATQHFIAPRHTTYRGPKRLLAAWAHAAVDRRTAAVIAVSDAAAEAMRSRGAGHGRLRVVHNGIDPPRQTATASGATGPPRVFVAARLVAEKGLDTLVDAAALVGDAAQITVAGEGEMSADLKARDAGQRVQWLGFRDDVPRLMAACDLFVLPAPAEPFGLVLLEAMAAGRAVIACDAGGPREIVVPNVTGLLVPPNDPAALAKAIVELCRDPERRRAMGEAGRRRFLERFTADRMAAATLAVYREVLGD